MLLPQFTIRRLFALTVAAALVSLVAESARRGNIFSQTVVMMLLFLGGFFLISAAVFLLTSFWARVLQRGANMQGESPFAEHRPPPQLIHPEDPV